MALRAQACYLAIHRALRHRVVRRTEWDVLGGVPLLVNFPLPSADSTHIRTGRVVMVPDHIDPSSSQDTVSRALVEAHKQVSAEAAPVDASASPSDARKAGSSRDAVAGPSVAPSDEEKKEAALKAHGFVHNEAVHGDGENAASTSRDKQECSSVISPLLSRSEKLCVRHQRMADEDATARLQKVRAPFSSTVWSAGAAVAGRRIPRAWLASAAAA